MTPTDPWHPGGLPLPVAPVAASPPPRRRTGGALVASGVVLIALGVIAATVLFLVGRARYEAGVEGLVRAPAGCDTSIRFTRADEFVVYLEHRGDGERAPVGCVVPGEFEADTDDLPVPDVLLFDGGRDGRAPDPPQGRSYEALGTAGAEIGTFQIERTGTYVVRVEDTEGRTPDRTEYLVAIGSDPSELAGSPRRWALLLGLGGVLLGGIAVIAGLVRRSRSGPGEVPAGPATPSGPVWTGPPPVAPPQTPPPATGPITPPPGPTLLPPPMIRPVRDDA